MNSVTVDKEIWRDVRGYEGLYQVSNMGRVRSLDREKIYKNGAKHILKGKLLTPQDDTHGYRILFLGRKNRKKVHRLVAEAFIPNPQHLPVVNHKDCNPSNNRVDNLEWCTQAYNMEYGDLRERQKEAKSIEIVQLTKTMLLVKVHESMRSASRETGINRWNIFSCCKGKAKSAGGYVWKYKNDVLCINQRLESLP